MKLKKVLLCGVMFLPLLGCQSIRQFNDTSSPYIDFKFFQDGKIAFYGNYPAIDSWIVVDCYFTEDLTWHLKVRSFDSNTQHEKAYLAVVEAIVLHIETFLIKHSATKGRIGGIEFSSEDLLGNIVNENDENIDSQKKHIQLLVSSLRAKLWKSGIKFQLPYIIYDKTNDTFDISMYRIDTED